MAELADTPPVATHLDQIQLCLVSKSYIECGWPSFAAVPLFAERFPDQLRIVHLVRHPVTTALSYLTHDYYRPSARSDEYTRYAQLDPFDEGVSLRHYQERWEQMNAFEKALFQWAEIHLYAQELEKTLPEIPFLRIRMEDMMDPEGGALNRLRAFAGLPQRTRLQQLPRKRVDEFRRTTRLDFEWERVLEQPDVLRIAYECGYDLDAIDERSLRSRYLRPRWGLWARVERALARFGGRSLE